MASDFTSLIVLGRVAESPFIRTFSVPEDYRNNGFQTPNSPHTQQNLEAHCLISSHCHISCSIYLRLHAIPFQSLTCVMKPQFRISPAVRLLFLWTIGDFLKTNVSPSKLDFYYFLDLTFQT